MQVSRVVRIGGRPGAAELLLRGDGSFGLDLRGLGNGLCLAGHLLLHGVEVLGDGGGHGVQVGDD